VGDLPPFIGLAVAAGGLVVGLVVVAVGRRLFAVPARGALLPWLAVSPGFVMLAASGLAMPPDWLAVATSGVLVVAAAWWMRATSVVQATWRCIPLIMLLNFWGGIAGQAGVPWLGPLSALAVVAEFTLIVAAMVLIAASEARLVPTATFYFGPLVPVPRPDRAFDHPFDSYARDA